MRCIVPFIGGLALLAGMPGAWAARRVLTIGMVPQMSPWALARRRTPVLRAWSAVAGVRIALRSAPTIHRFEQRISRANYGPRR